MTFDPFRNPMLPSANQAEIGNSSLMVRTTGKNQYLVQSLERDLIVQVNNSSLHRCLLALGYH